MSAEHSRIATVWKMEAPRLIAALTRKLGDLGLAEDAAQDALVAALEHWQRDGQPEKPGAWLLRAAERKGLDAIRHWSMAARHHEALGREADQAAPANAPEAAALHREAEGGVGDDTLRLLFMTCHPALSAESQLALVLKVLAGLSTAEIARAFLQTEATIAQRLVRAKRQLAEAKVPFELPQGSALTARLPAVLHAIYLLFNEGYTATSGSDWLRPALCDEALRLARSVAALLPQQPEAQGLLALLELQAARNAARTAADGTPILLADQDRRRWNRLLIQRGLAALARAEQLGGADGAYALQAAIAAGHARAVRFADTDWPYIAACYARLEAIAPSPVVTLNRAVAVSFSEGPAAALPLVQALRAASALAQYHLLPTVEGDLLARLGRPAEAAVAFREAASLTRNARETALLQQRVSDCEAQCAANST